MRLARAEMTFRFLLPDDLNGMMLNRAGNKVMVTSRLMKIPLPEINPSWATPLKSVGTKAKNPIAVVTAQRNSDPPTFLDDSSMAAMLSMPSDRSSR